MNGQCCGNCKFSMKDRPGFVLCRRHPPAVLLLGMEADVLGRPTNPITSAHFPTMQKDKGWCGEWAPTITQ